MRAAVIPTHSRPKDFADSVAAVRPQVEFVIAVAHGRTAHKYAHANPDVDLVIAYRAQHPNISTMWRMGLDDASAVNARWVAFINDDAVVSRNWFDLLQTRAEESHAFGASGERDPQSLKIAGFAFILNAESGVRPDERFSWWFSDDAIQKRCDQAGGFAIVPTATVEHRHPNESTVGTLRRIAKADRPRFRGLYP